MVEEEEEVVVVMEEEAEEAECITMVGTYQKYLDRNFVPISISYTYTPGDRLLVIIGILYVSKVGTHQA